MSDEIKDNIVAIITVLFTGIATIFGGILAWRKWYPESENLKADLSGKLIVQLEQMTDLYSAAMAENVALRKENDALVKGASSQHK